MKDIERRYVPAEIAIEERVEGEPDRITGYAAVFGRDSVDLGGFTEEIAPGAFANAIRDDDVRALIDHDSSLILGRKSAGTLRLVEDKTGLRMEIDLPDTTAGRDIRESVRRKDVTGASFSFRTIEDEWNTKDGTPHRTLKAVRLYDVGPVSFPAYPDTQVAVRSLDAWRTAGVAEDEQVERDRDDLRAARQRHAEAC